MRALAIVAAAVVASVTAILALEDGACGCSMAPSRVLAMNLIDVEGTSARLLIAATNPDARPSEFLFAIDGVELKFAGGSPAAGEWAVSRDGVSGDAATVLHAADVVLVEGFGTLEGQSLQVWSDADGDGASDSLIGTILLTAFPQPMQTEGWD